MYLKEAHDNILLFWKQGLDFFVFHIPLLTPQLLNPGLVLTLLLCFAGIIFWGVLTLFYGHCSSGSPTPPSGRDHPGNDDKHDTAAVSGGRHLACT